MECESFYRVCRLSALFRKGQRLGGKGSSWREVIRVMLNYDFLCALNLCNKLSLKSFHQATLIGQQ